MKKDIFDDLELPTDEEVQRETFFTKRKLANIAKNKTATMRQKAGSATRGKKRPNHSAIMKKSSPGLEKTRTKWICEHCGKEGVGSSNYVRWHGENCKEKR